MNTEQIIKMGYEAGLCDEEGADDNSIYISAHLTRFAALVAAAEREECAKVCDELAGKIWQHHLKGGVGFLWEFCEPRTAAENVCTSLAANIRARGQA